MKKGFILYKDSLEILNELTDEQAGVLFKAIKDWHNGIEPKLDLALRLVFFSFRNQFIRDGQKYDHQSFVNSDNGKKGGRPKKAKQSEKSEWVISKAKKGDKDKDKDNDTEKDKDKVNEKEIDISERQKKLNDLLSKNFPELMEFKKPLTIEQYDKLKDTFDLDMIEDKMSGLANRKGASKDYISVYSTLSGWLKKDFQKIKV